MGMFVSSIGINRDEALLFPQTNVPIRKDCIRALAQRRYREGRRRIMHRLLETCPAFPDVSVGIEKCRWFDFETHHIERDHRSLVALVRSANCTSDISGPSAMPRATQGIETGARLARGKIENSLPSVCKV
ncbi:hypothetical protein ACIQUG_21455 [Ensifer sp. NPDC090286]|uniref:hypothetical protein n=1 Tax=Ensifer sp. NPDC090286 TaxID=3363991 RepID=UPI00383B2DE0